MKRFDDLLEEQLQNEEFCKEYEAIQPELDIMRAIADARISQNLTQKELAERTGINQADISKHCSEQELAFSIFIIYSMAEAWNKTPIEVYQILNRTGILDDYIIRCYDTLHTLGKEYLVEDVTEFAREKGVDV